MPLKNDALLFYLAILPRRTRRLTESFDRDLAIIKADVIVILFDLAIVTEVPELVHPLVVTWIHFGEVLFGL